MKLQASKKLHPRRITIQLIYFFLAPDFFSAFFFGAGLAAAFFFAATLYSPPIDRLLHEILMKNGKIFLKFAAHNIWVVALFCFSFGKNAIKIIRRITEPLPDRRGTWLEKSLHGAFFRSQEGG